MNPDNQLESNTYRDFLTKLWNETGLTDVFLILLPAVIISIVYHLPVAIQQSLILDFQNPTLVNLWSAAFVHRGFEHFSNNLTAYLSVVFFLTPLFILSKARKLLKGIYALFLFALPPVISLLNILVIGQGTGAGFSGIVSAFDGLLAFAIVLFIRNQLSEHISPVHGVPLFLAVGGVIMVIYANHLLAGFVFVLTGLIAIYDGYEIGLDEARKVFHELSVMAGYRELILFSLLWFFLMPIVMFPAEIVQDGSRVNIIAHYVGLVFGFFGPTIYALFGD